MNTVSPNRRSRTICLISCLAMLVVGAPYVTVAEGKQDSPRNALDLQKARNETVQAFTQKKFYDPAELKLDDLPVYSPDEHVSGVIRIWGSDMFGGKDFKEGFERGFQLSLIHI